jgi:pSer/pThr/pTyr-binding forkhead associated (FHA) protein
MPAHSYGAFPVVAPTVRMMLPRLVSLDGTADFVLDAPLLVVGRHRACEIRIESSRVSRRHCCLACDGAEVRVRDLGSTNGTWINRTRVEKGFLRHGDVLGIAHLRFVLDSQDGTDGAG